MILFSFLYFSSFYVIYFGIYKLYMSFRISKLFSLRVNKELSYLEFRFAILGRKTPRFIKNVKLFILLEKLFSIFIVVLGVVLVLSTYAISVSEFGKIIFQIG